MQLKKKHIVYAVSVLAVITLLIAGPWRHADSNEKNVKVIKGTFETYITEIGELKAQKSLNITVPEVLFRRELDIWELKILDIVEEGKIVKKGDHVATLDPTNVVEELKDVTTKLDDYYNKLETAKLDSSLSLSAARDAIQKAKDEVLDKEIKVEQSVYESKAVQRQAKLELEQAKRSLDRSKRNLEQKRRKHKVIINRYNTKIKKYEERKNLYLKLQRQLNIKSPADGMIVYGWSYDGRIRAGSRVGPWAPLIATLPDLSTLMSEINVKEVNIAKIAVGNKVRITIDAFPDKTFTGRVIKIANIGKEIPGEYQNGFKVEVKLDPYHEDLLPGMTTTNTIITGTWKDALMVPKSAVFGIDSVKYVFKRSGLSTVKQKIKTGGENEDYFRITSGLNEGDIVVIKNNI
ncbi:MAG: HlyD family efflux transporter periplasmic adaptor subunit [Chlorobi bacterium]|nr:HlyD family efflux transporter periplasmic adaptor subunit [Chlorobiota bacterium]